MSERPVRFSETLAAEICRRTAEGKLLREICRARRMPHPETVRQWLRENSAFRSRYSLAREALADALAEDAIRVAREAKSADATACRLYVDAIKWYTARLAPKKYGERPGTDTPSRTTVGDAIEKGRERVKRLRETGPPTKPAVEPVAIPPHRGTRGAPRSCAARSADLRD